MIYVFDGVEFDLDCEFVDVTGVVWEWTGDWSPAGEPMLRGGDHPLAVPLPQVYLDHGPLIPRDPKTKASPSAAFAASLAAGLTESFDQFGARIGGRR